MTSTIIPRLFESPYICGIGGIGMSGAAHLLLDMGCRLSGSDLRQSELTLQLEARGADIVYFTAPERISNATCLIAPASFPVDHPEIKAAAAAGIPILTRSAAIAQICKKARCSPHLCFGTASRGKLPWIVRSIPEFGRCAGAAIVSENPQIHAKLARFMFIDVDEREFLCGPESFEPFTGSDVIISDWQNDFLGYYQQKSFASRYRILPEQFFDEVKSRILTADSLLIMPLSDCTSRIDLHFAAFQNHAVQEKAHFKADPDADMLHAPAEWHIPPMPWHGTINDASALAAALFWCRMQNIGSTPSDPECIGWFREIRKNQFHDIRMHPVNVHNSIETLRYKAGEGKICAAIKPFAQTLKSYEPAQWQAALQGTEKILVITPAYEGCEEEDCIHFADALSQTCRCVITATKEQAAKYVNPDEYWLWIGAGDIL